MACPATTQDIVSCLLYEPTSKSSAQFYEVYE